ncbi:DUF5320 domain-containing protein [Candidatus Bathyarchaeota archaeon]|nr:DUF5320 domain-containing protein [Candidatus Bathyarchaeota archaeon]
MCRECLPMPHTRSVGYCGCRFRQFLSPKEEVELLEGYKEQLRSEIAGVEERIKELKQKG